MGENYKPNQVLVVCFALILGIMHLAALQSVGGPMSYDSKDKFKRFFWYNDVLWPNNFYIYEWVRSSPENKTISIVWFDGSWQPISMPYDDAGNVLFNRDRHNLVFDVEWDRSRNLPVDMVTGFTGHGLARNHYIGLAAFTAKYPVLSSIAAGILAFAGALFLALSSDRSPLRRDVLAKFVGGLLIIGGLFYITLGAARWYGEGVYATVELAHQKAQYLHSRMAPGGYFLPLESGSLLMLDAIDTASGLLYAPAFLVLNILIAFGLYGIAYFIPGLPQWLHYLFVPHPAARAVTEATRYADHRPLDARGMVADMRRSTPIKPPPVFVSENMRRKAEEHAARLKADTELMRRALEREHKRAELEDERRRR